MAGEIGVYGVRPLIGDRRILVVHLLEPKECQKIINGLCGDCTKAYLAIRDVPNGYPRHKGKI